MLVLIIFFFILLFTASNLLFLFLLKHLFSKSIPTGTKLKKFSIVIALKNESNNIKDLINSLDGLNYHKEDFEVILVDDNSTDDTYEIIKSSICDKFNYLVTKADYKILPGKKGALDIGIRHTSFPYIMITDADCRPEPNWLLSFSSKFDNFDFLFGIAPFKTENSLINHISCFENLRSSILTFSFASLGIPYSAAARSFGFKKESFQMIDGYNQTVETLSGDDDLLIREAVKQKLKIGTITDKEAFVFSSTKNNLQDYLKQKARHTTTSNYYLLKHQVLLTFWHIINLLFLVSSIFVFISIMFLLPFSVKIIFDLIVVKCFQSRFGCRFGFIKIIFLQIAYEIFIVVNYLNAVFVKKVTWK